MRRKSVKAWGLVLCLALLFIAFTPLYVQAEEAPVQEAPPSVSAEAYVVMDANTGQVLVEKNPHLTGYPASITKILTLGIVLEQLDLATHGTDPVQASQTAVSALIPRATMIALQNGEVAPLQDLVYATQIESANDAANVLAEHVGGSMEGFAELMNAKAAELGLSGSHFVNPSGQPNNDHYTTAYDMAAITRWALSVPGFREVFGSTRYTMPATNVQIQREFHSSNMILMPYSEHYCEGVVGSKTGYTDLARYTLVTTAKRGDMELICVVLKCPYNAEKYNSTNALLDYCFNHFRPVSYSLDGLYAGRVPVYDNSGSTEPLGDITVQGSGKATFLLHNSLNISDVRVTYDVPERYVMGTSFNPTIALSLLGGTRQQSVRLAQVPLAWRGLDEIIAAKAEAESMRARARLWTTITLCVAVAGVLLAGVAGLYFSLQHYKKKKMDETLGQEALMPAQVVAFPQRKPLRRAAYNRRRPCRCRPGSEVRLQRVACRFPSQQPRRVGRAK